MRVLVCQTPKLTYVQAIELLQRETVECGCDLALLPEMALEHPPQCTCQGELTFENVALHMLSRFARQHKIYIVLGSVEERTPFAKIYDTCIVIDRQGELLLQYRKQSVSSPARTAGTEPGIFETEFGLVGLLLGVEAEQEHRWASLIAQRPCLLLNPTREPMKMDPALAKAHPELQVAAWHEGFSRLERIVDLQTRSYQVPFVRADAPLQEGGAGVSIFVEQHRSVLAPCWGSVFFIVETSQPSDLVSRRLPGWRQLTIDERIEAAQHDKEVLMQEEVMRGPRYLVWTFRLPQAQVLALKREGEHWAHAEGVDPADAERSWLMPLTSHGGRSLYAVATKKGGLTLWDVRQKRDVFTCNLGGAVSSAAGSLQKYASTSISAGLGPSAVVTALGPWHSRSQFILASVAPIGLLFQVYDESTPVRGTLLGRAALQWTRWTCVDHITGLPLPGPYPEDRGELADPPKPAEPGEPPSDHVQRPVVRAIYPVEHYMAMAVIEGPGSSRVPFCLLIDLETGTTEHVNIYGDGPVEPEEEEEDEVPQWRTESDDVEAKRPSGKDVLVGCHLIEQRFQERGPKPLRALVCLYHSNRVCLLTCSDWTLHEQNLLEEMASARMRADVPVACAILPNPNSGTYNIMVSYASMVIRWWQVSLSQCRLTSQVLLTSVATHVSILEWPSVAQPEKPDTAAAKPTTGGGASAVAGSTAPATASSRGERPRPVVKASTVTRLPPIVQSAAPTAPALGSVLPPNLVGATPGRATRQSAISLAPPAPTPPANGPPSSQGLRNRSFLRRPVSGLDVKGGPPSSSYGRARDSVMTRGSVLTALPLVEDSAQQESVATPASSYANEFAYHPASLLVVAFEQSGAMPLFLAHGGRMARVYECLDHFVYKSTEVNQLWCLERSIAVQLSNGDVRHFEFLMEGEVINLVDMPMEGA